MGSCSRNNINHNECNDNIHINTPEEPQVASTSPLQTFTVTILGFGSLLSEKSARTTFPNLQNFRLGKVLNYRRVFGHPASIFFQRNIANMDTLEISSLCAEPCTSTTSSDSSSVSSSSFVCSVFDVSNTNGEFMRECIVRKHDHSNENVTYKEEEEEEGDVVMMPSLAYLEREEEFNIVMAPYIELSTPSSLAINDHSDGKKNTNIIKKGLLCTKSTDENYIQRWGQDRFNENYGKYNIHTIWNWKYDSGLRPCAPYLRHCVLAAKRQGEECYNSFLDETFLVDRVTTIRAYLERYPKVMDTLPPPELAERYGG